MISSSDARTLARLRDEPEVSPDALRAISRPYRSLAEGLANCPLDDRDDVWQRSIAKRSDRREIEDAIFAINSDDWGSDPIEFAQPIVDKGKIRSKAVAKANPDGARPERTEPDDEGADEWGPIRLGTLPEATPFPTNVLPPAAARLVDEASRSIGCPADFVGVAMLAAAAGTIGRSISLRLKPNYFASSGLYAAVVGPPSDGKSPALDIACFAVRRIDEALRVEHEQAVERWRTEQERIGSDGKKPKLTNPPRPRRIDIDDATMEVLPPIMADNPRGLICIKDELSALMLGMNQFKGGKGSDRQVLLSAWSGKAIKIDRVKHEGNAPVRVAHPCLTIIGALTPDLIASIADPHGRDDGFLDRFLFAYPESRPIPGWNDRGVDDATIGDWAGIIARLWQRPLNDKEGRSVPHVVSLNGEALDAWTEAYDRHASEMNGPDFSARLRGPWGKLGEYAGRLVLILACLDHATDPTADPEATPSVTPRTVRDAWQLVDYFKAHARRVYTALGGKHERGSDDVQILLGWLIRNQKQQFTVKDVNNNTDRFREGSGLDDALRWLIDRNIIRPVPDPQATTRRGGRRPSPAYEVHPRLAKDRRFLRFRRDQPGSGPNEGSEGNEGSLAGTNGPQPADEFPPNDLASWRW